MNVLLVFAFLFSASCLCLADMNIVRLDNALADGALCLDGSPAIYYFKAGSKTNSTKWVLHLLGGGMCRTDEECYLRSQMFLGSSLAWGDTMGYGGPISDNATYNPDFYDWNHAFFVYCDGSCFSGDVEKPIPYKDGFLYYRGHRNFLAIMNDLIKKKGLDKATDVLVVGDSAGGMATFFHVDEIKQMLPSTVKRFKAAPFSGVFLDAQNVDGRFLFGENIELLFKNHNCSCGVNQKCITETQPELAYRCMFGAYTMNFIESPLFLVGSAYDTIGISCVVGSEPSTGPTLVGAGNCSAAPGWDDCDKDPEKCTKEQWEKIEGYGNTFMKVIENHPKFQENGNGLFECNCHSHAMECTDAWFIYTVQNTTMRDALGAWFFSDNEPSSKHFYKDCVNHESYSCNPCCSIPIP